MPPAHRKTDNCTGHGCFPPRPAIGGSDNTYVNSLKQMRLTDTYDIHCCSGCHGGMLSSGSSTVYVNNLKAGRQGDNVDCGSYADEHSGDVNIGG
jgi:uncharacterized Zn-binding protein involved in type VI secretion